jgi:PAS domain S-box-containing protein
MMEDTIKILFIEDVATDLELVKRSIRKSEISFFEKVVETEEDFIQALTSYSPDIILSDYSLPQFNGMLALKIRQELAPHTPFILITGSNNEETAVDVMKAGADDYILKDNLTRIGQAIKATIKKQEFIGSKKEAEEALFESEQLFRTAFENAAIGVCMVDFQGRFVNVNGTFCNMLGYLKEEIMQIPFNQITYSEDINIGTSVLDQLNNGEISSVSFEKRYVHKQGQIVWVNISTALVHSLKNKSNYFVSYIQDITERKSSEEQLIIAKEKAEESDHLKTAFLHNISHEIRTPMNAIVGFSGFLNDPDLSFEKRKQFIEIIVQSSNQLLNIITDIINIATIEAGQEQVLEKEININSTLKLLYDQFLVKAEKQNISLSYKTDLLDNEAIILTDETKLIEILTNLLGNALKFTRKGFINFGNTVKNKELEFYVEDSGIGIPTEMHEEIFKRFRQVEISANREFGGSGLGLSITKAYVELLGGKIWLTSEPDKGSIFYFTLPYKKLILNNITEKQPAKSLTIEFEKFKTLLIAEDEDSNFMLLKELLSDNNLKIIRAENGIEAVDLCKSNPQIDLVLMDIKMPKMDGYEATKQIKEFRPNLPIMAQTAYYTDIDKNKAFASGCVDFISKPIQKEILLSKINEQLHN